MRKTLLILAPAALAGTLFILIAVPLFHEEVFVNRSHIAPAEIAMIAGYSVILLFDLCSLLWLAFQVRKGTESKTWPVLLLILSVLCIIGLGGQKVMLDEVAHEYSGGWNTQGEWIFFLALLIIQIAFSVLIVLRLVIHSVSVTRPNS